MKLQFPGIMFCIVSCAAISGAAFGQETGKSAGTAVFYAPESIPVALLQAMNSGKDSFFAELDRVVSRDCHGLLVLVDKKNALDSDYEPKDLVPLTANKSYLCNKAGMYLRAPAEAALEEMAAAARRDGVTLVVSSAYRSREYQKTVYERNVRELGQAAADRESARPGTSQHQLGTAVDFGSITDAFAQTVAGKWLAANAGSYGWSLSFPEGYETVTGYRWESWHYRYVGVGATAFQQRWFGGIQQYMIEFIDAWRTYALRTHAGPILQDAGR